MKADIIKIDQSYPLDGSEPTNYIVVRLPTGVVLRAEVGDEETEAVIKAAGASNGAGAAMASDLAAAAADPDYGTYAGLEEPVQEGPREVIHPDFPTDVQEKVPMIEVEQTDDPIAGAFAGAAAEGDKIEWKRLPPNILSPTMKTIFNNLGLPEALTAEEIEVYVQKVVEGMEEGEQEVEAPAPQPSPPAGALAPPVQPRASAVVQNNASIVRRVAPIRTVQKDEMGYPRVAPRTGEVDPGEVVGDGEGDEDGVGSI